MWLFVLLVVFGNVVGDDLIEVQQSLLPLYTELDDYGQCLSDNNGLYCLGSFRIHPYRNDNKTYNFIKEYSSHDYRYDRTLFHRGYCVSSSCPHHPNPETRFETCVQDWASNNNLNTTLEDLKYCKTPKTPKILHSSSHAFMLTIFSLLLLNLVGTLVDLKTKDETKSQILTAWSIRSNWKQLVEPFGNNPDRTALAPIQMVRVVILSLIIIIHLVCTKAESFMDTPIWFEKILPSLFTLVYSKTISSVQVFFVLSSFLTSYNLLLLTKKQNIGLWMLPQQFLKRYFRIGPVHLLCIWFCATWWPHIADGPLWSKIWIDNAVCQRKFWTHVLHINNIIEADQFCLPQTWSLGADIQYQLISLMLTLSMAQYNLPKLKILSGLFISTCVLNGSLAYVYGWKSMLYKAKDINLADSFHVKDGTKYPEYYYLSPWGSLPSCLVGLIMGHVYFHIRQEGYKVSKNRWLSFACRYSMLYLVLWIAAGWWITDWKDPVVMAILVAMERPMFCIPPAIWLFGVISGVRIWPGFRALSRRIWMPLGRLSLSVLLVHWLILDTRIWSQHQPVVVSWTTLLVEFVVTWCLSYGLAVPLTLLVEMPMINTYDYVSKMDFKTHFQYKHVTSKILQEKKD